MTEWVIAEWVDEEGSHRAPSYQSPSGKWYRAGVSEYGGPTILLMDGEPVDVTQIQGAEPQRRPRDYDFQNALRCIHLRQEAIGDSVANLAMTLTAAVSRIERDLARVTGRPAPNMASLPKPSENWILAQMSQPVLTPARTTSQDVARAV